MIQRELFLPPITILILVVGLTTLSSAAPGGELRRQLLYLGVAVLACGVVYWLGRARIMRYTAQIYLAALGLLVLTQFFGTEVNGAQSWLYIGPLPGFQPSELAKLALIMVLAVSLRKHPITQNIQPFSITDELYYNQQGEEEITVLLEAKSKDTDKMEPLAWVYEIEHYHRRHSRVFQTVLGHDVAALKTPELQKILANAAKW